MPTNKATAHWEGAFKTGKGAMKPAHASDIPFSVATRFDGQPGSNPEEVIGAALAGCFSMALTVGLERAGATPKSVTTSANVSIEREEAGGFTIKSIELVTEVSATGIDDAKFQEVAAATKKGCPVSKALAAVPSLTLRASLV